MQQLAPVLSSLFIATALFTQPQSAEAQTCNYFAGNSSAGQSVNLDLCSISQASARSVDFVYYLDGEKITSQANCESGTWTTFPERAVNRPQSEATQNMLSTVCSYRSSTSSAGAATVFDPPSNVRSSPNGEILCSVRNVQTIDLYGSTGSWYYTDICGEMGVIDASQLRF